jgi:hypothetical protein
VEGQSFDQREVEKIEVKVTLSLSVRPCEGKGGDLYVSPLESAVSLAEGGNLES